MCKKGGGKNVSKLKPNEQKRQLTMLERNLKLQEVLERTAAYDMSLMDAEQNEAYLQRLVMNRIALEAEKEQFEKGWGA
jgi:outer membrane protein TolC